MSTVRASETVTLDVVDNPGRAALEAAIKGEDPEQAVYGKTGVLEDTTEVDFAEAAGESPLDAFENQQEDVQSDSQETTEDPLSILEDPAESQQVSTEIEEVLVKGPDGRVEKLKIDYSDKASIKDAFMKMNGMRKFQKERDLARQKQKDIQKEHTGLQDSMTKLEAAWKQSGVRGVVELLEGSPEAWTDAVEKELTHREYLANLSPEDKYKYDITQERQVADTKRTELEEKYQALLDQTKQAQETTELKSLESKLHPSFDRHRFAGKLGDSVAEHQYDQAVWDQVTKRLSEFPDDIELTTSLIDKEFKTVAGNFRKLLKVQTEKAVKTTINKKKAEASQRVQVAAKKGLRGTSDRRDFVDKIKGGDIKGSFMDVFTGKVKL